MSDFNEGSPKCSNTARQFVLSVGCMAVIGLVILIVLLPSIHSSMLARATRMQCPNSIKAIGLAMHNYHDVYKSHPPAYTTDEDGKPLQSWRVLILPFIEEQRLYDQIRRDEPWDSEYNKQFHDQMPSIYVCPSAKPDAKKKGLTSYMRIVGPETSTDGPNTVAFKEVTAGMSNVIWLVEVIPTTCWMAPVDV
ncbi:MAG: DUF1559 domain-containing protein, partial [Planctomycetaceae bacterium]|nr:DUF1559 domain-containing protein [Planctomycetaceae bacterium]